MTACLHETASLPACLPAFQKACLPVHWRRASSLHCRLASALPLHCRSAGRQLAHCRLASALPVCRLTSGMLPHNPACLIPPLLTPFQLMGSGCGIMVPVQAAHARFRTRSPRSSTTLWRSATAQINNTRFQAQQPDWITSLWPSSL